jgi:siroheme synthase-like protein
MPFSYPVFVDLHDVPVVVVGGGRIGARKVEGLAAAGASIRLVAGSVSEHVDLSSVADLRRRNFVPDDLDGARLVITATGDRLVDATVAAEARGRGVWVNAADQPVDCDFILPAIARAGRVTGAISTDGASPALAGWLRDRLAELLTERVARLADELATERAAVRAGGGSTEDIDWVARIELALDRDR